MRYTHIGIDDQAKAVGNLPPSHLEISKDDPDEEMKTKKKMGERGEEGGAAFFGLSRLLAVEAIKHCFAQLQVVWAADTRFSDRSLLGNKTGMFKFVSGISPGSSDAVHAGVLEEARRREKEEAARASAKNKDQEPESYLAQTSGKPQLELTGVRDLLNLVDEFVAHPEDNPAWWKPIFDRYVADHREALVHSILQRNLTRGERE